MNLPKPKLPQAARLSRGAKSGGSQITAPPFLADLLRDMRDRRLIVPALLLLVSIAAVPMLLRSDPAAPPPPVTAGVGDEAVAVQPAVLAETPGGVRDYRERLETFKQHNPFAQKFVVPPPTDESVASAGSSTIDSSAPATSTAGPSTSVSSGDFGSASISPAPGSSASAVPASSSKEPAADVKPERIFYDYRVDVGVGRIGESRRVNDVKRFDVLPSKTNPVLVFLGVTEDAKRAVFSVSRDVSSSEGDGECIGGDSCELVALAVGEKRDFTYDPTGHTYRLRLGRIEAVEVDGLETR